MLIFTAKLPNRKLALGVALAALSCCCVLVATFGAHNARAVSATTSSSVRGVKSNQDRVDFLTSYGWQVDEQPLSTQELVIPKEMDESYDEYLALQSQQGFDLSKYAGKRIKRYTYAVTNHPSGESGVQANVLIYRNTVIGGEVLSVQLDGFLHGLSMP